MSRIGRGATVFTYFGFKEVLQISAECVSVAAVQ
jgi:hypothetical protein